MYWWLKHVPSALGCVCVCVCVFQNYVPTVFENYTASFEIDKQRIELNMWDTSG